MAAPPGDSSTGEGNGARRWVWLALLATFGAEAALFWWGTERHYAWIYPRWFDQVQYLGDAYSSYQLVGEQGLARAAGAALGHASPQGTLHSILALGVFALAGPSRTAALMVNLLAFVALQAATFAAARRVTGGYPLAWAAVGLLAALAVPWSGGSGSATDFRLDWMSACAYGVALAAAVCSRGFRSTGWAAAFGVAVGVVLLERFLTGVYFAMILLGLAASVLSGPDRWARLSRLSLAAAIASALSGWAFWRSRHLIHDYYWVGHVEGPERALRDAHMSAGAALEWFTNQLFVQQVGLVFIGAAAAVVLILTRFSGYDKLTVSSDPSGSGDAWIVMALFFAAPALVLLLHPARASQPMVILVAPVLWLVVLIWVRVGGRSTRLALRTCAAVALLAGGLVFIRGNLGDRLTAGEIAQYRSLNALADFLYLRAEEAELRHPSLAVTGIFDGLSAEGLRLSAFERHGQQIPFVERLPTGLFAADPRLVRERLAASDFVCLVTRLTPLFPFDQQMAAMLSENLRWCEDHLRLVGTLDVEGVAARIYERRELSVPTAGGVRFSSLEQEAAGSGKPWLVPAPPSAPLLFASEPILWSTGRPVHFQPTAAYGPIHFSAVELPTTLSVNPRTGLLTGQLPQPGTYRASIVAANSVGMTPVQLEFRAVAADWLAQADSPGVVALRTAVDFHFRCFDGAGHLDFIDITDLTDIKVLARLTPDDDEHESWSGRFRTSFTKPGEHRVQLRFVRYDAKAAVPYTYLDQIKLIVVSP